MTDLEIIDLYFKLIIEPLEKEIYNLRKKTSKKKFYLTKNIEKEYLQKLEELLVKYYNHLEIFFK